MEKDVRETLSEEERTLEVVHTIDPGFVNDRRIQTIVGPEGRLLIESRIAAVPSVPDWQKATIINHIYSNTMLQFCRAIGIRSLEEIIATQRGRMFCSTEALGPCPDVYDRQRAVNVWIPPGDRDVTVEFHYSTKHITSSTLWSELSQGAVLSIIAELHSFSSGVAVFHPLIMGSPWMESVDPRWQDISVWWGHDFFENVLEDFDEFALVKQHAKPKNCLPMEKVSEKAFKACLAEILGGSTPKDWGGETSDFFSSHLHLKGRRVSGAFLLKGPAKFAPMTLDTLGKRNDQIVRLAREPADVLFVQHCHEISPPVRATLRAFSVQPSQPRRYCLIDGRDSLWLLQSYGLYEKAVRLSTVSEK